MAEFSSRAYPRIGHRPIGIAWKYHRKALSAGHVYVHTSTLFAEIVSRGIGKTHGGAGLETDCHQSR